MTIGDKHYTYFTWVYILVLATLRLLLCGQFELVGDEAYYWLWSRNLDISYYSKGPGIAWTIYCSTRLFGDTAFGIRFFSVVAGSLTALGLFEAGRRLFSVRAGCWCVILASITPLFMVGSMLMTIDPLSVLFWTWAMVSFWQAKDADRPWWWLLTGLFVGLGTLCKYTNLAQLVSFLCFCLWQPDARRHLRRRSFYAMLFIVVLSFLPIAIWNERYDWITVTHLKERGALDRVFQFQPLQFLEFLGLQCLLFFPFFFIGLFLGPGLAGKTWRRQHGEALRYLICQSAPLFLFYALLSWNDAGQPNWTAPAFVGALLLLSGSWCANTTQQKPFWKKAAAASVALAAGLTLLAHILLFLPLPANHNPLCRIHGARSLAAEVLRVQRERKADFVLVQGYQQAALTAFYLPHNIEVFQPGLRRSDEAYRNQFDFWPDYREKYAGRSALFVTKQDKPEKRIPSRLKQEFESIRPLHEFDSTWNDQPLRHYWFFLCENLRVEESD